MKNSVKTGMMALVSSVLLASQLAFAAALEVGDYLKFADGPGGGNGGAFQLTIYDAMVGPSKGSFMSFCVEKDEFMSFGPFYQINGISNAANAGGSGGPSPDPLDVKTAWLYTMYRENQVALGAMWGGTVDADSKGTAMQLAIWVLEEEIGSTSNSLANDLLAIAAAGVVGWTDNRVGVLNITKLDGSVAQDQLYIGPAPDIRIPPIPEPEIYAMLAAGLGLMGFVARRRRQGAIIA